MPSEIAATSWSALRDRYAIVGVGETSYMRGSGKTYTHGISMVIENVRQLRGDDTCPIGPDGRRAHSYDYRESGCRQVRDVELTANLGWGTPWTGSALVLRRG